MMKSKTKLKRENTKRLKTSPICDTDTEGKSTQRDCCPFMLHCTMYQHIRNNTIESALGILKCSLKNPVWQTTSNFCYFLQPLMVLPRLTTAQLKDYCLSFFPTANASYEYIFITLISTCRISSDGLYIGIYLRVSTLSASPLFVHTEKLLYSVVVTSGLDVDDTGRALGRQLKISNNNNINCCGSSSECLSELVYEFGVCAAV